MNQTQSKQLESHGAIIESFTNNPFEWLGREILIDQETNNVQVDSVPSQNCILEHSTSSRADKESHCILVEDVESTDDENVGVSCNNFQVDITHSTQDFLPIPSDVVTIKSAPSTLSKKGFNSDCKMQQYKNERIHDKRQKLEISADNQINKNELENVTRKGAAMNAVGDNRLPLFDGLSNTHAQAVATVRTVVSNPWTCNPSKTYQRSHRNSHSEGNEMYQHSELRISQEQQSDGFNYISSLLVDIPLINTAYFDGETLSKCSATEGLLNANGTITTATFTTRDNKLESDTIFDIDQKLGSKPERQIEENYGLEDLYFSKTLEYCSAIEPCTSNTCVYNQLHVGKLIKCKCQLLFQRDQNYINRNLNSKTLKYHESSNISIHPGMVAYTGFDEDYDCRSGSRRTFQTKPSCKIFQNRFSNIMNSNKKMRVSFCILLFLMLIISASLSLHFLSRNEQNTILNDTPKTGESGFTSNTINSGRDNNTIGVVSPNQGDSIISSEYPGKTISPSFHISLSPTTSPLSQSYDITSDNNFNEHISLGNPSSTGIEHSLGQSTVYPSSKPMSVINHEVSDNSLERLNITFDEPYDVEQHNIHAYWNGSTVLNVTTGMPLWNENEPCAVLVMNRTMNDIGFESKWIILHNTENSRYHSSETQDSFSGEKLNNEPHNKHNLTLNYKLTRDLQTYSHIHQPYNSTQKVIIIGRNRYFSDEYLSLMESVYMDRICLPKGIYEFVMYPSKIEFNLFFSCGREIRIMSKGSYIDGVEITPFEVTSNDILDATISSCTMVNPDSISTISSNNESAFSVMVTSTGDNLVSGISKAYGIIFDMEPGPVLESLIVHSIELYLDTSFSTYYEVHTRKGSWKSHKNLTGFRVISHGTIFGNGVCHFTSNCTFARIPLDQFDSVLLTNRSRQSFYVTVTTDDLVYQNLPKTGDHQSDFDDIVQVSTPELTIFYGESVLVYPAEAADAKTQFHSGGFIGRIIYQKSNDNNAVFGFSPDIASISPEQNYSDSESNFSEPALPANSGDSCFYYTEESCLQAAEKLGFSAGGMAFPFAGNYQRSGCYYYLCSNCLYGGHAYFGTSGSKVDMESFISFNSERRLDCTTKFDNFSKYTPFWCLFPSDICSSY